MPGSVSKIQAALLPLLICNDPFQLPERPLLVRGLQSGHWRSISLWLKCEKRHLDMFQTVICQP
ncbi:hypothetical protein XENOCAPTIV_016288, partial [Xenoophorus captivus]